MPHISVNGIDLFYSTLGDGPPLLMIGGLASDSASWAPITAALGSTHKLIMPDNRACGQTRDDGRKLTLRHYVDDMIALLDHLGLRSVDVLGHSMGGSIAMELSATRPDRINRVVLAASAPSLPRHSRAVIDSLAALREAGAPDEHWFRSFFCWLFHPDLFTDPRAVDAAIAMAMRYPFRQSVEAMRRQVDAMRDVDLANKINAISARGLVLAGERDLLFPSDLIEAAFAPYDNFQVKIIPGSAHSVHWDQPKEFSSSVLNFLDNS